MVEITTKAEAEAQGLKHYFPGTTCSRGHIDYHYISTGGCKTCHREWYMERYKHRTEKRRKYSDRQSFLAHAITMHGNTYDYSRVQYLGSSQKVEIICNKHGSFWQKPDQHSQGRGCQQCRYDTLRSKFQKPANTYFEQAKAVWGGSFDYTESVYAGARAKLDVRCVQHDLVCPQGAFDHLKGLNPCPKCNHMKSAPEDAVADYLARFTTVERRNRTLIGPKELDIYLPEHKLAVEFCGMYWHSHGDKDDERKNKQRHAQKHHLCEAKGVRLITLYETEWAERPSTVKRLLRNAMGKTKGKLMARKCELRCPSIQEARAFYKKYHPQGGDGSGIHYGLYWGGKLVACMRFTYGNNDRGHGAKERQWTLSRYATRVSVVGAASKLFKAFLVGHAPDSVKSFSDNRLFGGGMYAQLGFELEADVPPDYQVWSQKLGLRPKPHYQRRVISSRLRDHSVQGSFDPATDKRTEAEMTYLMGARRIYDCGKKRWVWKRKPL